MIWPFTVDDAFITFRYAANLAAGYGPTWNPGGPPIEGYTTFLWMLLMTIPHLLGIDSVMFSKVIGVLATLGCILVTFRFAQYQTAFLADEGRRIVSVLAPLMLVGFPVTAIHAVSGMETALFTLLMTLLLYLVTMYVDGRPNASAICLALVSLALGLTRPEGNLAAGVALLCALVLVQGESRRRLARAVGLLYILPGAVYFVWRYLYYGYLFPLPFYVKVIATGFLPGRYEVATFAGYLMVHVEIFALFALLKMDRRWIPSLAAAIVFVLFFVFPAQLMGYEWRYMFPVAPFVFILAALGAAVILDWMRSFGIRSRGLLMAVAGLMTVGGMIPDAQEMLGGEIRYAESLQDAHVALGQRLSSCGEDMDSPLLAVGDAGAVPYYSGWQTIDTLGLNDPIIATSGTRNADYVLDQAPDVVVLISADDEEFLPHLYWEEGLYRGAIERGMSRVTTFRFTSIFYLSSTSPSNTRQFTSDYYLWVLAAPGSPLASCLAE
jgi:arabinofuranosyltransferase